MGSLQNKDEMACFSSPGEQRGSCRESWSVRSWLPTPLSHSWSRRPSRTAWPSLGLVLPSVVIFGCPCCSSFLLIPTASQWAAPSGGGGNVVSMNHPEPGWGVTDFVGSRAGSYQDPVGPCGYGALGCGCCQVGCATRDRCTPGSESQHGGCREVVAAVTGFTWT